jgi:hypothetical protein
MAGNQNEDALPPLGPEFLAEIQRRSAEIDAGTVKRIPWGEVRAAALQRLGIAPNETNSPPTPSAE